MLFLDVDECAKGIHSCKSGQICENQIGFHICRCPSGHKMNSRYECEDIDECQLYKGRVIDLMKFLQYAKNNILALLY